jgi:hypothetical protein
MVTYAEETKLKTIKANWDLVSPVLDQIDKAAIEGNFSINFGSDLSYEKKHLIFLTLKSLGYSVSWSDGNGLVTVSWWNYRVYNKGEI